MSTAAAPDETSVTPARGGLVLLALILVATVANLNLSVANVALPDIGAAFDASQTALNLVAVGFSLGLAMSVLYLGALGDRYGRRQMLLGGVALSIPASVVAGFAPSIGVLFGARVVGGLAAGMAYPTTLALITALWRGAPRTRAIALWSGVGGAMAALGPLTAGFALEHFEWGAAFLLTVPLAVVALGLSVFLVPAHVGETTEPVDHIGGVLSVVLVAAIIMAINFAAIPDRRVAALVAVVSAIGFGAAFVVRQRRATSPLYDLDIAARRTFWVAAVAGIIVFGALMAAMYVGQLFLQNVLEYSTLESGLSILPGALFLVIAAPISARLIGRYGSRITMLSGYLFCAAGFGVMLVWWTESAHGLEIELAYALVGAGVGLAGPPASRSLTSSVPVPRAGMASGTADLQRDLGGSIMQSLFGALLTAGYAAAFTQLIESSPNADQVTSSVQAQLTQSFNSATATAQQYPDYANQIVAAARESFLDGANWAYTAGLVAVMAGGALVWFAFPRHQHERELLATYATVDEATTRPSE